MGKQSVDSIDERFEEGVSVLDEANGVRGIDGDYVQLVAAGTTVSGDFLCADCGYGVAVQGTALPCCPMCAGEAWEGVERAVRGSVLDSATR
jgi:hypothetical protein